MVGSLDLELKALRDGATSTLDVSVERLEKRWPALEGESEGVTAARRERSALEGSKCCGRLVAAAITTAARIVEVDWRGVALGAVVGAALGMGVEGVVVGAAEGHSSHFIYYTSARFVNASNLTQC